MAEELKNLNEVYVEREKIKERLKRQNEIPIFFPEAIITPLMMGMLLFGLPTVLDTTLSLLALDPVEATRLAQHSEFASLSETMKTWMGNMMNLVSGVSYLGGVTCGAKAMIRLKERIDREGTVLSSEEQASLALTLTELSALEERFLLEKACAQPLVTEKDRQRAKSL